MDTVGSSASMQRRLRSLIPGGWFGRTGTWIGAPSLVYEAVLGGIGDGLAWAYTLLWQARQQTRIGTASGWFLDLIGWDFFGSRFVRRQGEMDATWRARMIAEIFRPRVTRAGITRAVTDFVGAPPQLFEPWNTGDCGAYDVGTLAYAGSIPTPMVGGYDTPLGGLDSPNLEMTGPNDIVAYGSSPGAGCWGSYELPKQIFIKIKRPSRTAPLTPQEQGYGFFDTSSLAYGGAAFAGVGSLAPAEFDGSGPIDDTDIYATVASTVAAGVTAWTGLDAP